MNATSSRPFTVAVVDPNSTDYDSLLSSAEGSQLNIHFLSRGTDAIRFGQGWLVNLWLIATDLPDMSGFDLAQMLRHRKPGVRIFIVGNEYDVEDEIETLSLGLTKYLCKPLDDSWINCWGQPHSLRQSRAATFRCRSLAATSADRPLTRLFKAPSCQPRSAPGFQSSCRSQRSRIAGRPLDRFYQPPIEHFGVVTARRNFHVQDFDGNNPVHRVAGHRRIRFGAKPVDGRR